MSDTHEDGHKGPPGGLPGDGMTVAERASIDLQRGMQAMAKRAQLFGEKDPTLGEISEYDRRRFGMAVRFEVDVCIPLPDLKRELNMIRAELTNCLAILEQKGSGNERRKIVHSRLRDIRGELRFQREERKLQEMRQTNQP